MSKGGSRNRSGPQKDPKSGRSERAGYSLTALPAEGYKGDVPDWPLPARRVYYVVAKERHFDEAATEAVADRERELWSWSWRTPQACAWSMPSELWRLHSIAMWVRTYVLCESAEATAADKGSLHRFADQIGMTPAGLRENGWEIAKDVVADRAAERDADEADEEEPPRRRLTAVPDAQ
jgi:hypothetical protein